LTIYRLYGKFYIERKERSISATAMSENVRKNKKVDRRKLPIKWARVLIETDDKKYFLTVDGGNLVFAKERICLQVEVWKGDIGVPGKGKRRITLEPEKYGLGANIGVCDKDIVECRVGGRLIQAEVKFVLENVLRNENAWFLERSDGKRIPLRQAEGIEIIGSRLKGDSIKKDITQTAPPSEPQQTEMSLPPATGPAGSKEVIYYTDGSAIENPGPCGGAYCAYENGVLIEEKSIPIGNGTNNIGELVAIREAIKNILEKRPEKAVIYSDSQYVIKGITEWSSNWEKNGWMTSGGSPVKNKELFEEILGLYRECKSATILELRWVKGHNDNEGNERADQLALKAAQQASQLDRF